MVVVAVPLFMTALVPVAPRLRHVEGVGLVDAGVLGDVEQPEAAQPVGEGGGDGVGPAGHVLGVEHLGAVAERRRPTGPLAETGVYVLPLVSVTLTGARVVPHDVGHDEVAASCWPG